MPMAPVQGKSKLLSLAELNPAQIDEIFGRARRFRQRFLRDGVFCEEPKPSARRVVSLLFFEPSTRTRLSFQIAAERLGLSTVCLDSKESSSLSKGETLYDTIMNVASMGPDLLVVRHPDDDLVWKLLHDLELPVISAGSGSRSHPTQGLLDLFTMEEAIGPAGQQRVLIVGDVVRSRVAQSNLALLTQRGAQIGLCAPSALLPTETKGVAHQVFSNLEQGLRWCTVCMVLRIQAERPLGGSDETPEINLESYRRDFALTVDRLRFLKSEAIIMHPGPFVPGLDLDPQVLADKRSRIYQQVSNGVYLRAALLSQFLKLESV